MARRSMWVQMQREAEKRRRDSERAARVAQQNQLRREREAAKAHAAYQKEQQRLYLQARANEADQANQELAMVIGSLEALLVSALAVDDAVDFDGLKEPSPEIPFEPGELAEPLPEPTSTTVSPLGALAKLVPGAKAKHAQAVEEAEKQNAQAVTDYERAENERQRRLAAAKADHDRKVNEETQRCAEQHAEVDRFRDSYETRDPDAVVTYCSLVLASSRYPEAFPQQHRIAYVPESRQLVVEMDLPTLDVVPAEQEHRYVKAKDEITSKGRPVGQRKALYLRVVSEVTLRTVHEIFEADRRGHVESIVFNGHVDTIDPRTGQPIRPCLVTLRTTREQFDALDLARVQPEECLRGLNASVSRSPAELAPVRPVLDFNMVDPRFVQETDVLSTIDQRPNLMELTPGEFENLITNLFEKMGLETRLTQASRDGGVDCVGAGRGCSGGRGHGRTDLVPPRAR